MVYLIGAFLLIPTLIDKKNNKTIGIIWILFAASVATFNSTIADRISYYRMYERIGNGSFESERIEIGFRYLMKWANAIGLEKNFFFFIIFVVSLSIYYISFSRYVKRSNIVFLFYLLFPFGLDAAQIRSMLAGGIVLYGVWYLRGFSIKNILIYVSLIAIATTIHNSALFFLILCVCYLPNRKGKFLLYNSIAVIISIIILQTGVFFDLISKVIINSSGFNYIETAEKATRFYGYCALCIILILFYKYCKQCIRISDIQQTLFFNMMYYVNILSLWSCLFVYFNNNFTRLIRVFVILNFILLELFLENDRKWIKVKFSKGIFYLSGIAFCVLLLFILNNSNMDTTYGELLNHCELFNFGLNNMR